MNPIWTDPERMGGTPCFTGTRVPIQNLFDSLRDGDSIADFLAGFPTVKREQILAVLELSAEAVIPTPSPRSTLTTVGAE